MPPSCEACNDTGWVRGDWPVGHENFGQAMVCQACGLVYKWRAEKCFREARVPRRFENFTFDSYPISPETAEAVALIKRWDNNGLFDDEDPEDPAELQALERQRDEYHRWAKNGLFIHGPYGSGKTGLAVALLRSHHQEDWRMFMRVPDLLDAIRATYNRDSDTTEAELIDLAKKVHFLVLDDLGAERPTEWVKEKLFTIINYRHDEMGYGCNTVFTSNLNLEELAAHIGERTVWRIAEMCAVVHLDGPNLRVDRP